MGTGCEAQHPRLSSAQVNNAYNCSRLLSAAVVAVGVGFVCDEAVRSVQH